MLVLCQVHLQIQTRMQDSSSRTSEKKKDDDIVDADFEVVDEEEKDKIVNLSISFSSF